jgi:hypothetical protein
MKFYHAAAVVLGFAIPAFSDINLSTGIATYTVVEQNGFNFGATGTAQVVTPASNDAGFLGGWVPNSSSSDWVAFDPNNATGNGLGIYTTTFTLTAADLATASLAGSWTLDDGGSLLLNGHTLGTVSGGWSSLHPFSVAAGSSDFVQGTNTLSLSITGSDVFLEGVNLAGILTTPSTVPEPSLRVVMVVGLGTLLMLTWRRRRLQA